MRKAYEKPDILKVTELKTCVLESSGSSGGSGGGDDTYTPWVR